MILINADARTIPLADRSVHLVVCSPPFYGLRDYGTAKWIGGEPRCDHKTGRFERGGLSAKQASNFGSSGDEAVRICPKCGARRIDDQIGLEPTPEEFIEAMVTVGREIWRVLRDDGCWWLNLGDSFGSGNRKTNKPQTVANGNERGLPCTDRGKQGYSKQKMLIPHRVAMALQSDGWYVRADAAWVKGNPMPESVTDRPTTAHEYVFLLSKSERYFFDMEAVRRDPLPQSIVRISQHNFDNQTGGPKDYGNNGINSNRSARKILENFAKNPGRSLRTSDFWYDSLDELIDYHEAQARYLKEIRQGGLMLSEDGTPECFMVNTQAYSGAHYACFPEKLVRPMIQAGSSERGVCPKCGAGWVRVVEVGGGMIGKSWHNHNDDQVIGNRAYNEAKGGHGYYRRSIGWRPACSCNIDNIEFEIDDFEIINTPTGERTEDDPTMETGRRGFNRPRGENEGCRPITRYEQRRYAIQCRNSPNRDSMEVEAGDSFKHYIRTDKSGARPIPDNLLDEWISRGWLDRVVVPELHPYTPVPAIVLDPFVGSGTTVLVAKQLGRRGIGLDLSFSYLRDQARERTGLRALQAWERGASAAGELDGLPLFEGLDKIENL